MDSIEKAYLEILNENKCYFGFQINEKTFKPFEYKRVFCCASVLNKDINHIFNRLKKRTDGTIDDVFIVLKRGIDKFLELSKTKYKGKNRKSFHIISKEFNKFKLAVEIVKNLQKDMFKVIENPDEFFYGCNYVCFLYTILEPDMSKHPWDDELFVEELNKTDFENLYVD